MSINPRRKKSFKKQIVFYFVFLIMLGSLFLLLNSDFFLKKPLFINPLGKSNLDVKIVEKNLKDNKISFSNVLALSDSSYLIDIPNNGKVRLSSAKDIGKQISSLQRILTQLTIEGKSFKSIDFRFSEPVISF